MTMLATQGPVENASMRAAATLAILGVLVCAGSAAPLRAQDGPAPSDSSAATRAEGTERVDRAEATRPAGAARGAVVAVPDRFLRRWDPVTIFFPSDRGPAAGGPLDIPDPIARLDPAHAGAWKWLDARTLQFRPADPWPPLERFTLRVAGEAFSWFTLLEAPLSTAPEAGATGLAPIEQIALTFADAIDPAALARALTVETRSLPGVGGDAVVLGAGDFTVKVLERAAAGQPVTAVVTFDEPIPAGQRVSLHLRLAPTDPSTRDSAREAVFWETSFATREPFRVVRFGCRERQLPALARGARYSADQALACEDADPAVVLDFSADVDTSTLGPAEMRSLVRISPAVSPIEARWSGRRLELRAPFERERAYRVSLVPSAVNDRSGRPLDLVAANELTLVFARAEPYLRLATGSGVVERRGPRQVPVTGRGEERLDLRIHAVDAFDRRFWPFPDQPVEVDEGQRPPGPGEEPAVPSAGAQPPAAEEIAAHLRALGSPTVSALLDLPLRRAGGSASFGLDLGTHLDRVAGREGAGTFLVGVRRLGAEGSTRSWTRIQATDLALTTLEEPVKTVFAVTSIATARPVAGATVRVEGVAHGAGRREPEWLTLFRGTTDGRGLVEWAAPGGPPAGWVEVRRISVETSDDRLVLDPAREADVFRDNRWGAAHETWLQWTQESLEGRRPGPEWVAHLFTERPIYRPEDSVFLKGYVRVREGGRLRRASESLTLVIEGPGDLAWRIPVEPNEWGAIDHVFEDETGPTGTYRARLERSSNGESVEGGASFRKEAYRLPRFEVRLDAPLRAPLDRPFDVSLVASYYAGGRVAARPVAWRVTQFPYDWRPAAAPGFVFSSDARFARDRRFEATPALERADATDEDGAARLRVDPSIETDAQPRTYVVEATVVDADDQTVTATRQVVAVPPFLLGLRHPRVLEAAAGRAARVARPELLVLGPDEKPLAGQPVTVRLIHRQWHSHLRAADFADGVARYVTEVVEETVSETEVVSGASARAIELPLPAAGVYVIEVSSHDRLGRAQVLALDFFVAGDDPVTWSKPATSTFRVVPDQPRYAPGDSARLVLESPFQTGEALAVVETPEGNRVTWLPVRDGQAVFTLPIEAHWTPRLPVHFLLLRGRLPGTAPRPGNATDLGRPATFGATAWLEVDARALRAEVSLGHPARARPGQTIEIEVRLKDPAGRPLSGEVTLWLVDQAVLALAREARLDPVPSFLAEVVSRFAARDTRSLVFGDLPFAELPGGDEAVEGLGLLDRQTVRQNFQAVPFYEASIAVGPDGVVRVPVTLSDDLTTFAVRAKAVAGDEGQRFGFATSRIEVRQPVVLQPSLPRFVRPGDRFTASAVGRLLEGAAGAGSAEFSSDGLRLVGPARQAITWTPNRAERVDFEVEVPPVGAAALNAEGRLATSEVVVRMGVERAADRAGDAFEVRLPLRDDRDAVRRSAQLSLESGPPGEPVEPVALPGPAAGEAVRPGSLDRSLLVSTTPGLVELASALDFLLDYPYGCTEQRLATARAHLALRSWRDALALPGDDDGQLDRAIADVVDWLPAVQQESGLFAFWPGGDGSVGLTAWVVEFLAEAREAGVTAATETEGAALRALEQALRSDYAGFLDGESWAERTWALRALAANGRFDPAYGNELARRAQFLDLENAANVLVALRHGAGAAAASLPAAQAVETELWNAILLRLTGGEEAYAGLRAADRAPHGLLLGSPARTMAEMVRALRARAETAEEHRKFALLEAALISHGQPDGWGSTNANAAAIEAIVEGLEGTISARVSTTPTASVVIAGGDGAATVPAAERLVVGGDRPSARWRSSREGVLTASLEPASDTPRSLTGRADATWIPAQEGALAAARREGFVVERGWSIYRAGSGAPPERVALDAPGRTATLRVGDVVEERLEVVNPAERHYVAVVVPLAAGFEPLNPALETAPPEARPAGGLTLEPTYVAYLDDQVAFYYDTLPAGTFEFHFRVRAQTAGTFQQPSAKAEMMYDASVVGTSPGARVSIAPAPAVASAPAAAAE